MLRWAWKEFGDEEEQKMDEEETQMEMDDASCEERTWRSVKN